MIVSDPPIQAAVNAGYSVVPADVRKAPKVRWGRWVDEAQTDADREVLGHGSLWALTTGQRAGVVVLDWDGEDALRDAERLGAPIHVRTGDGGHTYAEWPGFEVRSQVKTFGDLGLPGLDIKGERSLAYFAGRSSKGEYKQLVWPPQPVPFADLHPTLQEAVRRSKRPPQRDSSECRPFEGEGVGASWALDKLQRAAVAILDAPEGRSNDTICSWGRLVGGLIAGGHLDEGHARDVLSAAAEERVAGGGERVDHMIDTGMTEPMSEAEARGVGAFDEAIVGAGGDAIVEVDAVDVAEVDDTVWEPVAGPIQLTTAQLAQEDLEQRTLSIHDLMDRPPPRWLIPGYIQEGTLAELAGPPSAGKSLLAFQWSLDLATKGKRVLYAAAEGLGGFGLRARAQAIHRGVGCDELPTIWFYENGMNLADPDGVDDLVAWVRRNGPWDLLVIDTLARALPGVDENSATEMGGAVHAAERLRSGRGTVLLVHHTGHESKRGRGSSAVLAACDNVVHCIPTSSERDGRGGNPLQVKLTTEKLKDGRASKPTIWDAQEIDLGNDLSSVVLVPAQHDLGGEVLGTDTMLQIEEKVAEQLAAGIPWSKGRDSWRAGPRRDFAKVVFDRHLVALA